MSPTVKLAMELIERPSVTPEDAGCQEILARRLEPLGFRIEPMQFAGVHNIWARRGSGGPVLAFAGHTDVVPPGPLHAWDSDPFEPALRDGVLYGRGAADMKGSLAAMVSACEAFVHRHPRHRGSLALLVTSNEEGESVDGTARVLKALAGRDEHADWCVVGEPTAAEHVGDTIKNGRRGSVNAVLTVRGVQGHVAYPHLARNPVHAVLPALAALRDTTWDEGDRHFPPTSFQIANIHAGTGATNVIPGEIEIQFNFRYSPAVNERSLRRRVEAVLHDHGLEYALDWQPSARPFLTADGELLEAAQRAVAAITERQPALSTSGGTSDGRFFAAQGSQVIELGPVNASIHKANENVAARDLDTLAEIYANLMERLLASVADR
ncbi:MAG TPA: succinyl-diaminopimelate desuccinylase [Gammaproteobacteria bacterium]|nr:succinyl-diaminopimelate desuccinylase [Gammaproteobacteria bacterium]